MNFLIRFFYFIFCFCDKLIQCFSKYTSLFHTILHQFYLFLQSIWMFFWHTILLYTVLFLHHRFGCLTAFLLAGVSVFPSRKLEYPIATESSVVASFFRFPQPTHKYT